MLSPPTAALSQRVTTAKYKHYLLKVRLQTSFLSSGGSHDVTQVGSGICCWTKRLKDNNVLNSFYA